jgi:hypothetical protein
MERENSSESLDNGRIKILDGSNKREFSTNINKAAPSTSDISNGCSGSGLGSGININFCPVINPTINSTINPL